MNTIKNYFKVEERGSSVSKEIVAGVIIFVSMFYIVALQAGWLGAAFAQEAGTSDIIAMGSIGILVALTAGLSSWFMGLYANAPLSLASGIGVGSFVAFSMTADSGMDLSYSSAMFAIMVSGLLFMITSITPLRKRILDAIPGDMKNAISVGIGFFLMFIALYNSGIIGAGSGGTPTYVGNLKDPAIILALLGIMITIVLWLYKVKGGVLIAMGITIAIGLLFGLFGDWTSTSDNISNIPSLSNITWDNYASSWQYIPDALGRPILGFDVNETLANPSWYLGVIILFLNDFFDTAGTIMGVNAVIDKDSEEKGIKYRTDSEGDKRILIVDSTSTFVGSFIGTTNVTVLSESNAGIMYGGRTGITACTSGTLFLCSIPLIPLLTPLFTAAITAGAIVLVGIMIGSLITTLNTKDNVILVSTIFTIMFMILGYSIGVGIVAGLLSYVILMLLTGRYKELNWELVATCPLFLAFIIAPLIV